MVPWISRMTPGSNPKEVIARRALMLGVHPFCRTKMAEKSSLFLPSPYHKCLSKGEPLLQGKEEIMASNLHSAASSPVFCAARISWSRLEKRKELAQVQLQSFVKCRPWAFSRFGTAKLLHAEC